MYCIMGWVGFDVAYVFYFLDGSDIWCPDDNEIGQLMYLFSVITNPFEKLITELNSQMQLEDACYVSFRGERVFELHRGASLLMSVQVCKILFVFPWSSYLLLYVMGVGIIVLDRKTLYLCGSWGIPSASIRAVGISNAIIAKLMLQLKDILFFL